MSFPNHKNLYLYSSTKSFVRATGKKVQRYSAAKYSIFKHLLDEGYTVTMNIESCQILSGECGMFASLFLIFYCLKNIKTTTDLKAIYNSFAFLGDKTVGMYKELLFWREYNQSIKTVSVSSDRLKLWNKVLEDQLDLTAKLASSVILERAAISSVLRNINGTDKESDERVSIETIGSEED